MKIKIILAGATGWMGKSLSAAICSSPDLELVAAVDPRHGGENLGTVLGIPSINLSIAHSLDEVCGKVKADIFVDFTNPQSVKNNVLKAISHGLHVIVGTSGLTAQDYDEINSLAQQQGIGVIACGNFSITAALLKYFASLAASIIPHWEIIDYASAQKPDAPSGTARELADSLAYIPRSKAPVPVEQTIGIPEARGGTVAGTQVHSVRLPSYTLATEIIFGLPHEKLILRHDAGNSPEPYILGVLLATRRISSIVGLVRGLDILLEW